MTKNIPIGIDDFQELIDPEQDFLFVDKSLMIKEFLDKGVKLSLILRPRRWGKTLNMSMLRYFFAPEVDGLSTKGMFDNLKIAKEKNGYYLEKYQGKYPVILISFKGAKKNNFEDFISEVKILIQKICNQYPQLEYSEKISGSEKDNFKKLLFKTADNAELCRALETLSVLLRKHYGRRVFILIDEYDAPLNYAYDKEYFEEVVNFFKGMFGAALKGNEALEKGVMTGILRLSKNNMLSDLNNLKLYSLVEEQYSSHFGFSEQEVRLLLQESGISIDMKDLQYWYNGYRSGSYTDIYNPWSILNCIDDNGKLNPYWIKTGSEDLLKTVFNAGHKNIENKLVQLLEGGSISGTVDEYISFDQVADGNEEVLWSLLWATGYLKFSEPPDLSAIDGYTGALAIPNHEVSRSYRLVFPKWIRAFNRVKYDSFLNNLVSGKLDAFVEDLKDYMLTVPSYFDFTREANYHAFLLGLTASLKETHHIHSNQEVGLGRPDMLLIPKKTANHLAIILEFKREEAGQELNDYQQAASNGLHQIEVKHYDIFLKSMAHIKQILKCCIVFYGKQFVYGSSLEEPLA